VIHAGNFKVTCQNQIWQMACHILNYYQVIQSLSVPCENNLLLLLLLSGISKTFKHPHWWKQAVTERCDNAFNLLCTKKKTKRITD